MIRKKDEPRTVKLIREMQNFSKNPPHGIRCWAREEGVYDNLVAQMRGPEGSPYEAGSFNLEIQIPQRYPFEPPHVKFLTPIYHPNIDKSGRICMNMLKMPPKGTWLPTNTLEGLLLSIQLLVASPNPDDPLMMDIAMEFKDNRERFLENARAHTKQYATGQTVLNSSNSD